MTALEAEITVAKGGAPILSGVRVRCNAGQCLVVLGENGAGKSVLLRSLALGEAGATGEMCVLGRTFQLADGVPEDGPWPDLTIVLQSLALWPHLTAADNVLLPWQRRDPARRLDREALDRLFNRLDITDLLTRYPAQLSGGQRQRVALARALALRPRVLLLDEPSAALDARRSLAVLSLLAEAKADGVALILVTHSLGFAARLADSYVFLHQGSLVDSGAWNLISQSASPELRAYLELNAFSQ